MKLPKNRNVLVIGDLHEPFTLTEYKLHCEYMYKKWKCNMVVFLGDIMDNHYISFFDVDPNGFGAQEEFDRAKRHIEDWYKTFPNAIVTLGNHDVRPRRQAFKSGLVDSWLKPIDEALGTPGWDFVNEYILDGVLYVHGMGRVAHKRMLQDGVSVVQGHYHSDSSIRYDVGRDSTKFSMQVGCGFDRESFAAAYGKNFKYQHHNVGVVLDNGRLPILEYMDLILTK